MVKTNSHDFIGNVLPLLSGILSLILSFYLNKKKSDREEEHDQYDRLNKENEKLTNDLDKYRKIVQDQNKTIMKLEKELGTRPGTSDGENENDS